MVARALTSAQHPVLAQLVPIRRCNLSCAYCNEYDRSSPPVPTELMFRRVDRLAALGTSMVDISGGEPLLHPELDAIVRRIRQRGMIAGLLTNGYLLTRERIERLNRAGLDRLQISIDNVTPDEVSHKSLTVLDYKLQLLAAHALFDVNINTVLGAASATPEDALAIARRGRALGFTTSVGLIHDAHGQAAPLNERQRQVYEAIVGLTPGFFSHGHDHAFQQNLARGLPNQWHCRAGARYLYVCEDGLVHWCSQQRGYPAVPLETYTAEDLRRERATTKSCAPYCTVSCVHRVALVDELRERPKETVDALVVAHARRGGRTPVAVKLLVWGLLTGPHQRVLRRVAGRVLAPHRAGPGSPRRTPAPWG
ncbi:MAG: radical SAM protein [Acidobacteria bacterium]|nr:radical SAM protein [Acidobacteriota bacterium]